MQLGLVLTANFLWGIIPIYYYFLGYVEPRLLISMQIILVFASLCAIEIIQKKSVAELINLKDLKQSLIPGFLISSNWLVYLLAMITNNVIDAGMGYFFTPIFAIILARLLLNEEISKLQVLGVWICILSTLIYFISTNLIPYYGIGLAVTFSLYALWHKSRRVIDSTKALRHETALMVPFAILIFSVSITSELAVSIENRIYIIMLIGPITLLPLYLFVRGCPGMPAITLGLCQYLAPAASLVVGVLVFGEQISNERVMLVFSLTVGVFVLLLATLKSSRKRADV